MAAKDQVNVNLWSFLRKSQPQAAGAVFSAPGLLSLIANDSFSQAGRGAETLPYNSQMVIYLGRLHKLLE